MVQTSFIHDKYAGYIIYNESDRNAMCDAIYEMHVDKHSLLVFCWQWISVNSVANSGSPLEIATKMVLNCLIQPREAGKASYFQSNWIFCTRLAPR